MSDEDYIKHAMKHAGLTMPEAVEELRAIYNIFGWKFTFVYHP